ncbi:hypothetical protein [Microcella sp.]|uniref:hypothetical protein n=1 Tax=Microcella sp. TaxID=1913979 RepID=UPI0025624A45|nr:hypothetical protein [Microcella sp.]MBX9472144.1 hypothetical protein [Microcella sp.]
MGDDAIGCPAPGSTADRAAELRRQARLVDDLFDRIVAIRRGLPTGADLEGWRGAAADLFTAAVDEQGAHLGRQVYRLDTVRSSLRADAYFIETETVSLGGMP